MKWYVHDEFDCFDEYETAEAAAKYAEKLFMDDIEGVHIVYMTKAQHAHYCTTGDLKAAFAVK